MQDFTFSPFLVDVTGASEIHTLLFLMTDAAVDQTKKGKFVIGEDFGVATFKGWYEHDSGTSSHLNKVRYRITRIYSELCFEGVHNSP